MPSLPADIARARFADARVARLGTIDAQGRAHIVPVVFAVVGGTVYSPIDHKPKTTPELVRARNIEADPRVTLLVDHYDDDAWEALWWVCARGLAALHGDGPDWRTAVAALTAKYEQYRREPLTERMLAIDVEEWAGWAWTA